MLDQLNTRTVQVVVEVRGIIKRPKEQRESRIFLSVNGTLVPRVESVGSVRGSPEGRSPAFESRRVHPGSRHGVQLDVVKELSI